MDLKKLRELAETARDTAEHYRTCPHEEDDLAYAALARAESAYRRSIDPASLIALLDALKNMGLDADHAREERDRMQAELGHLRKLGGSLATIAFNITQRPDEALGVYVCATLDKCRKEWDAAMTKGGGA